MKTNHNHVGTPGTSRSYFRLFSSISAFFNPVPKEEINAELLRSQQDHVNTLLMLEKSKELGKWVDDMLSSESQDNAFANKVKRAP